MNALFLLVICTALGAVIVRLRPSAAELAGPLDWWVLNIALPALVLELMPTVRLDPDLWFLPVSMWAVFLLGWAMFAALGRVFRWSAQRIATLSLTAGLGNTLFVGYPLIEALRGRETLGYAVVADQIGTFPIFVIGGIVVIALYGAKPDDTANAGLARVVLARMLRYPTIYALVVGLVVGGIGGWPTAVEATLARIGATLTPIALFSVGLKFRADFRRGILAPLLSGLAWKLLLAPAAIYAASRLLGIDGPILVATVLQAGMGPMISAVILARQHGLESDLAFAVLGVGMVLSLVTVPAINSLL